MTGRYIALTRTIVGETAWDSFVHKNDEAWLWHSYAFSESIALWPMCEDFSFALIDRKENDQIVALLPLRKIKWKFLQALPFYILESLAGPAINNSKNEKLKRGIYNALRNELIRINDQGYCLETRVFTSPMSPAYRGERCPKVNPLLDYGFENNLSQTWVVDLRLGENAVWSELDGRARTAVRKAKNAGVIVRLAKKSDVYAYYKLHVKTYLRSGITPHPLSYFQSIWDNFVSKGMSYVWLAELEGEVVAAENFAIFKQAAVYWTGASSQSGLEIGANSLLQWEAMKWMISHGLEWYETGEAFPHVSQGKRKGLNNFKKSFGGKLYPFYRARLENGTWSETLYQIWKVLRNKGSTYE